MEPHATACSREADTLVIPLGWCEQVHRERLLAGAEVTMEVGCGVHVVLRGASGSVESVRVIVGSERVCAGGWLENESGTSTMVEVECGDGITTLHLPGADGTSDRCLGVSVMGAAAVV